jgi:hypothetical protein
LLETDPGIWAKAVPKMATAVATLEKCIMIMVGEMDSKRLMKLNECVYAKTLQGLDRR